MKEINNFNFVLKVIEFASNNLNKIVDTNNREVKICISPELNVAINTFMCDYSEGPKTCNITFYKDMFATSESFEISEKNLNLLNYKLSSLHEVFVKYKINEVLDVITSKSVHEPAKNIDNIFDDED